MPIPCLEQGMTQTRGAGIQPNWPAEAPLAPQRGAAASARFRADLVHAHPTRLKAENQSHRRPRSHASHCTVQCWRPRPYPGGPRKERRCTSHHEPTRCNVRNDHRRDERARLDVAGDGGAMDAQRAAGDPPYRPCRRSRRATPSSPRTTTTSPASQAPECPGPIRRPRARNRNRSSPGHFQPHDGVSHRILDASADEPDVQRPCCEEAGDHADLHEKPVDTRPVLQRSRRSPNPGRIRRSSIEPACRCFATHLTAQQLKTRRGQTIAHLNPGRRSAERVKSAAMRRSPGRIVRSSTEWPGRCAESDTIPRHHAGWENRQR